MGGRVRNSATHVCEMPPSNSDSSLSNLHTSIVILLLLVIMKLHTTSWDAFPVRRVNALEGSQSTCDARVRVDNYIDGEPGRDVALLMVVITSYHGVDE